MWCVTGIKLKKEDCSKQRKLTIKLGHLTDFTRYMGESVLGIARAAKVPWLEDMETWPEK